VPKTDKHRFSLNRDLNEEQGFESDIVLLIPDHPIQIGIPDSGMAPAV
jgi:hypothetical protein